MTSDLWSRTVLMAERLALIVSRNNLLFSVGCRFVHKEPDCGLGKENHSNQTIILNCNYLVKDFWNPERTSESFFLVWLQQHRFSQFVSLLLCLRSVCRIPVCPSVPSVPLSQSDDSAEEFGAAAASWWAAACFHNTSVIISSISLPSLTSSSSTSSSLSGSNQGRDELTRTTTNRQQLLEVSGSEVGSEPSGRKSALRPQLHMEKLSPADISAGFY